MSWLKVGKSFNPNGYAVVVSDDAVVAPQHKIEHKRRHDDFEVSSDSDTEKIKNKRIRISNIEEIPQMLRKSIDISWCIDRRRGSNETNYLHLIKDNDDSFSYSSDSSCSSLSREGRKRKKKNKKKSSRKEKKRTNNDAKEKYNHTSSVCFSQHFEPFDQYEIQEKKNRYFARSFKSILLGTSFNRFKIDCGIKRNNSEQDNFTISYLPLSCDSSLIKFFHQDAGDLNRDNFINVSGKIVSDQYTIMTRIKFWSELNSHLVQNISSDVNFHEFDDMIRSFSSVHYLLSSFMQISSGQWDFYPMNFFLKAARMVPHVSEKQTNEKIIFFLEQFLTSLSNRMSENDCLFDAFSSKIVYHLLLLQQKILSSVDLDRRLSEFINDYPISVELYQLVRLRLRTMYPSSSFKKLRDYEINFWNEMQMKAKNKAAARRLMLNLSGNTAAVSAEDEESLLRSIHMQRYRIECLANYSHILQVMGYQEHCVAFFQCLVTIHLREMEETNAVFLVREVLRQWENETEPRLGEIAYSAQRQWNDSSIILNLTMQDGESMNNIYSTEDIFPTKSKVLSDFTAPEGPVLPPPIIEETHNNSATSLLLNNNVAGTTNSSQLEVVNGKVLMYSRLHGYKIWVPVDAAAEDTTVIYRRILDTVDDDYEKSIMSDEKKQKQRSVVAAKLVDIVSRLIYKEESAISKGSSYLQFVHNDSIAACLQFSPLRALGLNHPDNEEMALKEMEHAEKYPEKVVFSDDLKPFMFSMRDNTTINQGISAGIRALSFFLAHLGPTALGIHCIQSVHGSSREMEQLYVNASIFIQSSPTLAIICELLRHSHPLNTPETKAQTLSGCLQMLDNIYFPFAPIFVSEELVKAHIAALSANTSSLATTSESRLVFVTRIFHQILQHAISFQNNNWNLIVNYSRKDQQWLDIFISQLRQSLLHLTFVRYKSELQCLISLSSKHATVKGILNEKILQLVENCRKSCRAVLEESSIPPELERNTFDFCMAGDLRVWAQYLFIEKELLLIVQEHNHASNEKTFSLFVPIWKMADKVLRILDGQRAQALSSPNGQSSLFPGEVCFYSSIVTLLLQILTLFPAVSNDDNLHQQRLKHLFVCKKLLVQRAIVSCSASSSTALQQQSPLKLLLTMDGKNKKHEKNEDLFVNPMELQEATQLWQSLIQLVLTQTCEESSCQQELLNDIPDVVHAMRCQAILCGLCAYNQIEQEKHPANSELRSRFQSFQSLIQVSLGNSGLNKEQTQVQRVLKLVLCELHLVHVQFETMFSLLFPSLSQPIATVCEWVAEGLTQFPDDPRLLGCWVHLQYYGKGFCCTASVHHGYRKLRQYWQRVQTQRALRYVTQDVNCLREFQQYQGCSGEYLSVRERCFEIAVEFLRHNRLLFDILYANETSKKKESSFGTVASMQHVQLLPDWKVFFTSLVPHYRVMYEYHSYDEIITGDKTIVCLPVITESYHRLSALFEQILTCTNGQHIPWIWRLYIHTTLSIGDVDAAKKIARRGLAKCGYCKAIFVDLLGSLTATALTMESYHHSDKEKESEEDRTVLMRMMESQGIFFRSCES